MKQQSKEDIYKEQEGKCFFCSQNLPLELLTFEYIFPRSISDNSSTNDLVLSCRGCSARRSNIMPFREIELTFFLKQLLDNHPNFRNISREAILSNDLRYRADIIAERKKNGKWKKILIELKSFPTFTGRRLNDVMNKLKTYKSYIKEDTAIILSFPGNLPQKDNQTLENANIEVWDRDYISNTFKEQIKSVDDKLFQKLFSSNPVKRKIQDSLISELKLIPAGRSDWSKYQKHIEK